MRHARTLTRSPELAHDAVQETFLRYMIERRYGRVIGNPQSWLHTVMRNYLRRRLANPLERSTIEIGEADRLTAKEENPEALAGRAEATDNIARNLSRRELECFQLRAAGMAYAEIAEAMGIPKGTVGSLLSRVLSKIQTCVSSSRGSPAASSKQAGRGERVQAGMVRATVTN